eukprot:3070404-Prymnesium_polylepis.1
MAVLLRAPRLTSRAGATRGGFEPPRRRAPRCPANACASCAGLSAGADHRSAEFRGRRARGEGPPRSFAPVARGAHCRSQSSRARAAARAALPSWNRARLSDALPLAQVSFVDRRVARYAYARLTCG